MKIKKIFTILITFTIILFTNYYSLANNTIELNASSALLIDNRTNKILYNKDANKRLFPASTTKIVTAIIVLENHSLNEEVTASYDAVMTIPSGYSTANIQIGEVLTVEQLLELLLVHSANDSANVLAEYAGGSIDSFVSMMNTKVNELGLTDTHFTNPYGLQEDNHYVEQLLELLLVHSANDSANVLAEYAGGSIDSFVSMMNTKVNELGLTDTHFTNPYGLQEDNHYTTSHDLAVIMQYCLKNETFRKISGQASCAIPATNKSEPRKYSSTNELLIAGSRNYYPYLIAGKTGYTSKAGGCLVSVAYNNNLELISVILNSNDRFGDTKKLFNYGYSNFSLKNIVNEDDIITSTNVKNAKKNSQNLDLKVTENVPVLVNNNDNLESISPQIEINSNIEAPIEEGQNLGKVSYTVNGVTYSTNLVASQNIEKSEVLTYLFYGFGIIILILLTYRIFASNKHKK